MSKRPFNKIRKFEKKENIEGQQPRQQYKEEQAREAGKPSLFPGAKKKINIINPDALKNNQDNHHEEPKISLGSKPNLFKGKRQGNKLLIPPRQLAGGTEAAECSYGDVPKPTPQITKKRGRFDFRKGDRENIVMQEQQQSMGYQLEESRDLNEEDSTNLLKKPDMKIKRLTPKRQRTDIQQVSHDFSENRSFTPAENYIPGNIEYREINVEPSTGISEGKVDKQKKRTNQLSHLLNLETDLYQQTLSIGNITAYEIYINKIKGGFLKNSLDQAFDQKATNYCQTLSFEYADFTNQCPQDYSIDVNKIEKLDSEHLFDSFILRMAPVIEELIQPTNTITDPPIFLLAFRPSFKSFIRCPYPIFIYRSEQYSLDLIVVGQKLFIAEGQIESVLMMGKSMIAGLKNGYLILWNGENNKSSRLYQQIKEFTNTTNFELPSFCSHHLQKYSPYGSEFSIVSLLQEGGRQFSSLDSTGKIVKWQIQDEQNGSQSLKPVSVSQLRHLVQKPSLKAYSLKKRGDSYYVNTSMGIVILYNNEIKQKLHTQGSKIVQYEIPKRSPLVFTITQTTLNIYNELYSHPMLTMNFSIGNEQLREIIIPELDHDNRQIIILSVFYVTDSAGHIYEVKLLENHVQQASKLGEDALDGRKDKNVIYRGVNRAGETLETLKLMRDLKLVKNNVRMGINREKTVANLKSIIEKNRELMTMLEEQCAMMV